jgi:hypothetical protein
MLSTLSSVKARLAIPDLNVEFDDLLTTALTALSARFDRELPHHSLPSRPLFAKLQTLATAKPFPCLSATAPCSSARRTAAARAPETTEPSAICCGDNP